MTRHPYRVHAGAPRTSAPAPSSRRRRPARSPRPSRSRSLNVRRICATLESRCYCIRAFVYIFTARILHR